MTDAATDQGNWEDDCPLCLEPLPPFWDTGRRVSLTCCDKDICAKCEDGRKEFLDRAHAEGMYGHHFVDGTEGVERNVETLMFGAKKGDPMCQFVIGIGYQVGSLGLQKSAAEAKRWYLAAAAQGHAIAEYNLALMVKEEGNHAEYQRYMSGSASKGYDDACYTLGGDYYYGECGLRTSTEEAVRVLTPPAERGHAGCMGMLGLAMCCPNQETPDPVANSDFTRGMYWLQKGVEGGGYQSVGGLKMIEGLVSGACFRCHKRAPPETTFLRCSRCRAAWYCSKDCQRRHWKAGEGGHKKHCIKWE